MEPGAGGYVPDPTFVTRMATTLLQGLNQWVQNTVRARVLRLTQRVFGKPDEAEAKAMAAECAAPPGTVEVMASSLTEIVRKYDALGEWTPEAMFCVSAGSWALAVAGVWRRLGSLEATVAAELAKMKAAPPAAAAA